MIRAAVDRDLSGLREVIEIAKDPWGQARGRLAIRRTRNVIRQEFQAGAWFAPSGRKPWPATKPFGRRPATVPPLGGPRGAVASPWLGGPGGFTRIRGRVVTIGARQPFSAMHRGGSGRPRRIITRVKAKRRGPSGRLAMVGFLGANFGVNISEAKARRGLEIPSRPHVDARAPQYRRAAKNVLVEAVAESST